MSREIVLEILLEVMEKGQFAHLVIRQALDKYVYLKKQERAFMTRLAYGTIERAIELDAYVDTVSSVKTENMKPVIRNILRMTAYQLLYLTSVPPSAACNEAVRLAKKKGFYHLSGFVNGVCRGMVRGLSRYQKPESLSLRCSVPDWMIQMWERQYGRERMMQILEEGMGEAGIRETVVRCNQSKTSTREAEESLRRQCSSVRRDSLLSYAFHISGYDRLEALEAFQNGWIQVQDVSSMMAVEAASPAKGSVCIDVCAAPGGKSLHLADWMEDIGVVESRDLTWEKVSMIEENRIRSGFSCIRPAVWDATVTDREKIERADVVLADLPCSGLGVIENKPDIKYKMTEEKIKSLVQLQRQILKTVQQYVKPGGVLVYSTCTINREENEENAKWFLEQFPFEPLPLEGTLWETIGCCADDRGMCQIFPKSGQRGGFFLAKFRKAESIHE